MKTVIVTGADRGLGYSICDEFLKKGFRVLAGQFMPEWKDLSELADQWQEQCFLIPLDVSNDLSVQGAAAFVRSRGWTIDLIVNNAGIGTRDGDIRENPDFGKAGPVFNVNSLGPLRMVQAFQPLMASGMKRLCFISSEAGSISVTHREDGFGYCMSKAALNLAIRQMHNHLQPLGFSFRVYHPGWLRSYMSGHKGTVGDLEPEESAIPAVVDFLSDRDWEENLAVMDNKGVVWPF